MALRTLIGIVVVSLIGIGCILMRERMPEEQPLMEDPAESRRQLGAVEGRSIVVTNAEGTESVEDARQPSPAAVRIAGRSELGWRPSHRVLGALRPGDAGFLLREYRRASFHRKRPITWALVWLEHDEALQDFVLTLEGNYGVARIGGEEYDVFQDTLLAIGLLAERSDVALQYLLGRTTQAAWAQVRRWNDSILEQGDLRLRGSAVAAIGLSGGQRAQEILDELKAAVRHSDDTQGIVTGYFYHHVRETSDREELWEFLTVSPEGLLREFQEWTRGDERGRELFEWMLDRRHGEAWRQWKDSP